MSLAATSCFALCSVSCLPVLPSEGCKGLEDRDSLSVGEGLKQCVMEFDVPQEGNLSFPGKVLLSDGLGCVPMPLISFKWSLVKVERFRGSDEVVFVILKAFFALLLSIMKLMECSCPLKRLKFKVWETIPATVPEAKKDSVAPTKSH